MVPHTATGHPRQSACDSCSYTGSHFMSKGQLEAQPSLTGPSQANSKYPYVCVCVCVFQYKCHRLCPVYTTLCTTHVNTQLNCNNKTKEKNLTICLSAPRAHLDTGLSVTSLIVTVYWSLHHENRLEKRKEKERLVCIHCPRK